MVYPKKEQYQYYQNQEEILPRIKFHNLFKTNHKTISSLHFIPSYFASAFLVQICCPLIQPNSFVKKINLSKSKFQLSISKNT
jgi:hypothetical protein